MKKSPCEAKRLLSHHSDVAKKLALAIHDVHLDSSIISAVLQSNNGEWVETSQIRHWCRRADLILSVLTRRLTCQVLSASFTIWKPKMTFLLNL
jgi:hypothetical protein